MIPQTPRGVLYLVIGTLCLLTLGLYGAALALIGYGKSVPGEVWLAAGQSTGWLGGLLGVAHMTKTTQDVQVVNADTDPVPVDAGSATDGGMTAIEVLVVIALLLLIAVLLGLHPHL